MKWSSASRALLGLCIESIWDDDDDDDDDDHDDDDDDDVDDDDDGDDDGDGDGDDDGHGDDIWFSHMLMIDDMWCPTENVWWRQWWWSR